MAESLELGNVKALRDDEWYKEYEVSIDAQPIMDAVNTEIAERAKVFKLAGFREGKVPLSIVRNQIGQQVLSHQVDLKVGEFVQQIITQHKFSIAAKPLIEVQELIPDKQLKFTLKLQLLPHVPDVDFDDSRFKALKLFDPQLEEADLERARNSMLEAVRDFQTAPDDYQAQVKDAVIVDYTGKIDNKEFEGNAAQKLRIVIGDKQFVEDLESQLIGLKKGDRVSINVKFPDDYEIKEIAGRDSVFDVTVHEVLKSEKAKEVDDKLVKEKFGIETAEEFNRMLRARMVLDVGNISKMHLRRKLFDIMDEVLDFSVPEESIKADLDVLLKERAGNTADVADKRTEEEVMAELKRLATRRVKIGFALADIVRKYDIHVTDDEIQAVKQADITNNPKDIDKINAFYDDPENVVRIKASLIENKALDFIINTKLQLQKVPISLEEFNKKLEAESALVK